MLIKRIIQQPWFGWFDLACITASYTTWYLRGRSEWWPLLIALIPWVVRLALGVFPYKRTSLDPALAIFLITAGVGVWASYDRSAAWSKFWVIALAIILYYSLAAQPRQNLWPLVAIFCFLGASLAIVYLLSNDWQNRTADLALLNRLGKWWEMVRPEVFKPEVPAIPLGPNNVGGILAILLPFTIILILHSWVDWKLNARSTVPVVYGVITFVLVAIGLFWTSSRGAWLALAVSFFIWCLWSISQRFPQNLQNKRGVIFALILLSVAIPLLWISSQSIYRLIDMVPGSPNGMSRLEIYENSFHLIGDFPFTGGGLAAFPGLYSQYMLVIPTFYINYAHNFLLGVAIEQGYFGLIAIVWIFLGSFILLGKRIPSTKDELNVSLIGQAVLAGIIVVAVHGLLDDALNGYRGTPILFLLPGLAATISFSLTDESDHTSFLNLIREKGKWTVALWVVAILIAAVVFSNKLLAAWWANLGAVHMARSQLVDFPSEEWDDISDLSALSLEDDCFARALMYDPTNRTANHRLGLQAMLRHDYPAAVAYLVRAFQKDQHYRGINKNLGYSHVWLGQYSEAQILLQQIPESEQELDVYVWWWDTQERSDLSERANQMLNYLNQMGIDN